MVGRWLAVALVAVAVLAVGMAGETKACDGVALGGCGVAVQAFHPVQSFGFHQQVAFASHAPVFIEQRAIHAPVARVRVSHGFVPVAAAANSVSVRGAQVLSAPGSDVRVRSRGGGRRVTVRIRN